MALPAKLLDGDPSRTRSMYGVALSLVPSNTTLFFEVQRAPDSAGAPDVGAAVSIAQPGPFPRAGGVLVDFRPNDGARWHYRARHTGPDVTEGAWSVWVSAITYRLREEVLERALARTQVYPLSRTGQVDGQVRTLSSALTYLAPNAEFEVWESASLPHAWTVDTTGGAVVAKETGANVFSGDVALKYTNPDNATAGGWHGVSTNDPTKGAFCVPLRPGASYTFRLASRSSIIGSGQQYRMRLSFNAAESLTFTKAWTYRTAATYQFDIVTFTVPTTAEANSKLYVEFNRNGSASATDFLLDSIRVDELVDRLFFDNGDLTGSVTIDWAVAPTQRLRMTGNLSPTFVNGRAGQRYVLETIQDGTGGRSVTWPGSVTFASDGNTQPATGANKSSTFGFEMVGDALVKYRGYALASDILIHDVKTAVGSFAVTSAQTFGTQIAVTGCGFTPKVVLFFWNGRSDASDASGRADPRRGFGAASSTSQRRCQSGYSKDATAVLDNGHTLRDDACVAEVTGSASTGVTGLLDIHAFGADGFTMIVDDQFTNTHRVFFLAIGGNTVQAKVGTVDIATGTGNISFTDPGFQPTGIMLFGSPTLTAELNDWDFIDQFNLGFATSTTQRWTEGGAEHSVDARSYGLGSECYAGVRYDGGQVSVTGRADFVSFDANGFTINRLETFGTIAANTFYVALAGVRVQATSLTTRTDTTSDIVVSGLQLQPKALLFLSHAKAASTADTPQDDDEWSLGVAAATPAGGAPAQLAMATMIDRTSADAGTAIAYNSAYVNMDTAAAVEGKMLVTSFEADGFRARMSDADPSAAAVGVLALGV